MSLDLVEFDLVRKMSIDGGECISFYIISCYTLLRYLISY